MGSTSSLYAAIDLGSNSFHMLVVREVAGSIQTLTRIKRKSFKLYQDGKRMNPDEFTVVSDSGERMQPTQRQIEG